MISKATSSVKIVVEKGHKTDLAAENVKVPRIAFDPLSQRAFTSPTSVKPKVEISSDSSDVEISDDSSEESVDRKPPAGANSRGTSNVVSRDTSFNTPQKMNHVPKLMKIPFKSPISRDASYESPKISPIARETPPTKLKYVPRSPVKPEIVGEDYGPDFARVTVKKISERKSGVSVTKTEGKFILTAVPNYEKRISVGDEVLAINGTRNINTAIKANDLIDRTKGNVVLIVNFDGPKDFECPCCGEAMTCKGMHIKGKGGRGKDEGSVAESDVTAQAGNTEGAKKSKVPSIPETPLRYNVEDYDSESESDDESEESELIVD